MRVYTDKRTSFTEADRLELARLLVKDGYTVRLGRERAGSGNQFRHFVEFTKEGKADAQ